MRKEGIGHAVASSYTLIGPCHKNYDCTAMSRGATRNRGRGGLAFSIDPMSGTSRGRDGADCGFSIRILSYVPTRSEALGGRERGLAAPIYITNNEYIG